MSALMSEMTVDVAVIPAAGRGTRMLPATRAVPKSFIPVIDRPALQHVVEEAARAGAREVYVVVDPDAVSLLRRHFDVLGPLPGLEDVHVEPVVQEEPAGLGHAVLLTEPHVAGRPFTCLLVDNLVRAPEHDPLLRMIDTADGRSVLLLYEVEPERLGALGVVFGGAWLRDGVLEVRGAVEKPSEPPSPFAILGRYVFQPMVFEALRELEPGFGGELQLTDAIDLLAERRGCIGMINDMDLLDVGSPYGLLHASTVLGLGHHEYGDRYFEFLRTSMSV